MLPAGFSLCSVKRTTPLSRSSHAFAATAGCFAESGCTTSTRTERYTYASFYHRERPCRFAGSFLAGRLWSGMFSSRLKDYSGGDFADR